MANVSQDYFLRLRFHHRNLLALSWEEKAALAPSYEGQLVPLANHIVQLRRRPEFTAINQTADRLLRLQEEVVRDLRDVFWTKGGQLDPPLVT